MKICTIAFLALALSGCGAASPNITPGALAVSARDAFTEARATARGWDSQARLRYVEGLEIAPSGRATRETGVWRYHYTAPGRSNELLVRVAALGLETQEQPPTSPPGYVLGGNAVGTDWIDSPEALAVILEDRGGSELAEMVLVPTTPARWVVRFPEAGSERWVVNAETGGLMSGSGN